MPIFEFKATDEFGKPVNGTLLSASLVGAAEELAKRGLAVEHVALAVDANDPIPRDFVAPSREAPKLKEQPISLIPDEAPSTEKRPAIVTDVLAPLVMKVPLSALLFFFRQLSTMLNAGVPMMSSLETLSRQTHDPRLQRVVIELAGHVREGRPISVGMQRYPEMFTPLMLSLVRTGEESGMLDNALKQMADYIEREIEIRNLIRKSTLYPKVVIGASIVIIMVANYIIKGVMNRPGGIVSPLTEPETWIFLGPMLILLVLFARIGPSNPRFRHNYDAILLKIPGIGVTVHEMAMAKFSRALSALYRGGVFIPKAVQLSADACGNDFLRSKLYPASKLLEEGGGITDALRSTGACSQTVLDMTNTGEQTVRIDEMLEKVADYYEEDSAVKANQLAIFLGVLCLMAVAAYVGYIVINFYQTGIAPHYQNVGD